MVTLVGQGLSSGRSSAGSGVAETSAPAKAETELRVRALEEGVARLRALEPTSTRPTSGKSPAGCWASTSNASGNSRGGLDCQTRATRSEIATDRRLQKEALDAERGDHPHAGGRARSRTRSSGRSSTISTLRPSSSSWRGGCRGRSVRAVGEALAAGDPPAPGEPLAAGPGDGVAGVGVAGGGKVGCPSGWIVGPGGRSRRRPSLLLDLTSVEAVS